MGGTTQEAAAGRRPKVLIGYSLYFLGKIIPAAISFATIPVLYALFGKEFYGQYAIFNATTLIVISFSTGWICQGIVRFYAPAAEKRTFTTAILALAAIALAVVGLGSALFGAASGMPSPPALGVTVTAAGFFSILMTLAQVRYKVLAAVMLDTLKAVIFFAAAVGMATAFSPSPSWLIFALMLSYLIPAVVFIPLLKGSFSPRLAANPPMLWLALKETGPLLKYGTAISVWFLLSYVLNLSDRYFIKAFLGIEAVGYYAAYYDIIYKGIGFIFTPLLSIMHPRLVELYTAGNHGGFRKNLHAAVLFETLIFAAGAAVLLAFGKPLLNTLIRDPAHPYDWRLCIFIFAGAYLWQLAIIFQKPLEMHKRIPTMVIALAGATAVNMAINAVFLRQFGLLCAAAATLLGALSYLILLPLAARIVHEK